VNFVDGDYEWYLNADLDEYTGKWVVILNKKVVGSGTNIKEMLENVRKKHPNAKPLLVRVPEKILRVG
jgi:orotate phosphoribosyltransferase-like protein